MKQNTDLPQTLEIKTPKRKWQQLESKYNNSLNYRLIKSMSTNGSIYRQK